ncbi:MAG: S1/P1 nuclease [Pseudomonadales bacterium]|jgi:hypothetical protein|nr:S1/P1 nuclease [Pseudomonadales bacterium]
MPVLVLLGCLCCVLLTPLPASAWGQTGHRVTGAIADRHLSSDARAAVQDLLGVETLAEASTWPDEMRSAPGRFWQETAEPWHYVTVPPGRRYAEVGPPPRGDAMTALTRFSAEVVDPALPREARQRALRFIVHLIGDLHQPLHVGNGSDRGGNDFQLRYFGQSTNLHRLWDSQLIDRQQLSYTEWTAWLDARITPALAAQWSAATPADWIAESAALRDRIYPDSRDQSWDYGFEHLPALRERLSQAGVRIAAWLNRLFEPG